MKKLLMAVIAGSVFFTACDTTEKYKLSGKIEGQESGKIYLNSFEDKKFVKLDSADIVNGTFEIEGHVENADVYYLSVADKKGIISILLENVPISIEADVAALHEAKITGSASQDLFKEATTKVNELKSKEAPIIAAYQKAMAEKNQGEADAARKAYEDLGTERNTFIKNFAKENGNSVASALIVAGYLLKDLDVVELEEIFMGFSEDVKASTRGKAIKEKIDLEKSVAIGQPAPDFTLNTPEGTPLSLSSLKGKVVLIDFWASWCGPCRRENPHMVELYKELSPKGVEFLGVSLDKDKASWLKAIEDDGLVWKHVSDLKFWNSEAAKIYGVKGIPATYLIDQNGIIVAKKVFGANLKAEIEKLLN